LGAKQESQCLRVSAFPIAGKANGLASMHAKNVLIDMRAFKGNFYSHFILKGSMRNPPNRRKGISNMKFVCPKCGCDTFLRIYSVSGTWPESFTLEDGKTYVVAGSTDSLIYGPSPKTVRCEGCGKRLPNPTLNLPLESPRAGSL